MGERNKGTGKNSKPSFHSRVKKAAHIEKQVPPSAKKIEGVKLSERRIRHFQPETVNIVRNSLKMLKPVINDSNPDFTKSHDYTSAVSAIKTALAHLADTLTHILTDDPGETDSNQHHDLLAHFFESPGTENNGIHLVATSNIEALSEDLQLEKNSRDYNWLMNNGMTVLEHEILSRINNEMTRLETGEAEAIIFQHERAIQLQSISEKKDI